MIMNKKWRYLLALIVLLGCFTPVTHVYAEEIIQSTNQGKAISGSVRKYGGKTIFSMRIIMII